jgi:apolipoprotein N-acyltransferase
VARVSIARSAGRLRTVRGWRRGAAAVLAGAASAFSFAPFDAFPLLLLGYAALLLMLDGSAARARPLRSAAATGWAYGFGFFLVGLHWVGYAFLVNAAEHAWLLPFAAMLLPGGLGLFFAAGAMLYAKLTRGGPERIFLFAAIFSLVEWLRGHILTGFPWNLPGYGWSASTAMLQSAAFIGVYGLSVLTLAFGASLALLAPDGDAHRPRAGLRIAGGLGALFLLLWIGGAVRLGFADYDTVPGVRLRLVQASTPQSEKYVPRYVARNWQRLIALSAAPAAIPPTHIIWPEAAPPFVLTRQPDAMAQVAQLTARGRVLLTGDVRIDETGESPRFYNSFDMFGRDGRLIAESDKFHLVPFGEYLPFESELTALGITQIAGGPGGFSEGPGPRTFEVPGAPPVTPLICYEVIFPGAVTGMPRPGWLVNMTDDSWFGPEAGPRQHLLIARVRAIEEGLPIARAANSGISAVIDPYGRVRAHLDLGLRDVLDADLPVALPPTLYSRYGGVIVWLLMIICAGAGMRSYYRRWT